MFVSEKNMTAKIAIVLPGMAIGGVEAVQLSTIPALASRSTSLRRMADTTRKAAATFRATRLHSTSMSPAFHSPMSKATFLHMMESPKGNENSNYQPFIDPDSDACGHVGELNSEELGQLDSTFGEVESSFTTNLDAFLNSAAEGPVIEQKLLCAIEFLQNPCPRVARVMLNYVAESTLEGPALGHLLMAVQGDREAAENRKALLEQKLGEGANEILEHLRTVMTALGEQEVLLKDVLKLGDNPQWPKEEWDAQETNAETDTTNNKSFKKLTETEAKFGDSAERLEYLQRALRAMANRFKNPAFRVIDSFSAALQAGVVQANSE